MHTNPTEITLSLHDTQWPFTYTDHDRQIVRAIVLDEDGMFCFVRAVRDDDFGALTTIETAGGGVESGEDLHTAIRRELNEELGAEVEILCKLGVVDDYYNLIHRHNINHYYLCKAVSFGQTHLTVEEEKDMHLSTWKLPYEEAVRQYEACAANRLGKLIADREIPILRHAKAVLDSWEDAK